MDSKRLLAAATIGIALAGLSPAPAARAQGAERDASAPARVIESLGEGVRSLLRRLFGESPEPAPKAAAVPAVRPATSVPGPEAVKATPVAAPRQAALHEALGRGELGPALAMIEQGADIEARDADAGASALHYAVMRGSLPMVDMLIARGANVNSRTRNETTPLHTAILYARLDAARLLLDNGADVNAKSTAGATPLALAEAARNQPIGELLRSYGAR